MPVKGGKLTPRERLFSATFAATGDAGYSGHKAGYSSAAGASQALRRPAVQEDIRRQQTLRIENELLPLAVDRHVALLRDPATSGQVLVRAIEAGYRWSLARAADDRGKAPHEMTAGEIAQVIEDMMRIAAELAAPVIEHEPASDVFG